VSPRASKKKEFQPIRLNSVTLARIDRVLEELNRRSRDGEFLGGMPGPEVSRMALIRALLEPALQEYEKKFKLPKMEAEDGNED
jgi:hypothetical protein